MPFNSGQESSIRYPSNERPELLFIDKFEHLVLFTIDASIPRLTSVSQSVKLLLGYHPKDLYNGNIPISSLLHQGDLHDVLDSLKNCKCLTWDGEHRLRHANGRWFWMRISLRQFDPTTYIGICRDISREKQREQFLWREIVQRENSKDKLHELKTTYGRIRDKTRHSTSSPQEIYHISKREYEVLCMIAEGYSARIIADRLNISQHTAINHRKNLIKKLNVRNSAELVKKAFLYSYL